MSLLIETHKRQNKKVKVKITDFTFYLVNLLIENILKIYIVDISFAIVAATAVFSLRSRTLGGDAPALRQRLEELREQCSLQDIQTR